MLVEDKDKFTPTLIHYHMAKVHKVEQVGTGSLVDHIKHLADLPDGKILV